MREVMRGVCRLGQEKGEVGSVHVLSPATTARSKEIGDSKVVSWKQLKSDHY